ncbi:hypothetical protein C4D16_RS13755 [Vibrio parahaemolyticus]|nr:hypothetical protein [Vibrio parahaemolyticus]KYY26349.1 hypothetical protein AWQ12_02940 [Vibrio parahaemolyticus]
MNTMDEKKALTPAINEMEDFLSSRQIARKKSLQQNTISLFTPADNCYENMAGFIESAKNIHAPLFDHTVNWNAYTWNIAGFESTVTTRAVTHAANILFTEDCGKAKKVKISKEDETPFKEPFASEVKAIITHKHHQKRVKHETHMVLIGVFRLLYIGLEDQVAPSLTQLRPEHFDLAIRYAMTVKKLARTTLSVWGDKLAMIAGILDKNRLTPVLLDWRNPIERHSSRGGAEQAVRGGKEAEKERAKKLPKTEVLVYLAALWANYEYIEEKDKSLLCMAIILLLVGFRMDEFVGLDINCIPTREEYEQAEFELDPQTGVYVRPLRIRVWAKKKAEWDEKIVPPSAVETVYEAVERLKVLSAPHRYTAKMMLEEGKWDKFIGFDDDDLLSAKQIQTLLGISGRSTSNTITAITRLGVEKAPESSNRNTLFRVGDIHEAASDAYRERIAVVKDGFGHETLSVPIWDLLTLRYHNQYTPKERLNVFAEPLSGTHIQDFFRGRDYTTRTQKSGVGGEQRRIQSVFERYSFPEIEAMNHTVRTHQFRHLLNTMMQESDMFSQEDIAKNFLRSNSQDNSAYNHQIEPEKYAERNRHIQENVLKKLNIDADQAKMAIQRYPLLSNEEMQQDLDESGSYHFTDIGRCRHDYTQWPCGMHYSCLRNCINYKREKGNAIEVEKITARLERAEHQMTLAKEDADDEFTGANNWYLNHKELVEGCKAALAIEKDPRFAVGEIVQVFPFGVDNCEEVEDE